MIDVHCTSEFFDLVSPSGYSRWNFNGILAKHLDQRSSPTTFELTKTAGNFHRAPFAKTNNKRGLARSSVERITKHLLARQLLKEDPVRLELAQLLLSKGVHGGRIPATKRSSLSEWREW